MKVLIDKLVPGSLSDLMIWVVVIGGVVVAYHFFADKALYGLAGLFFQKNNSKRKAEQAEAAAQEFKEKNKEILAESEALSREENNITDEMTKVAESEPDEKTPINQVVKDAREDWS